MTKAVLAETDRQFAVTHNFSSVGFERPTAMLAKTNGHISKNGFWMPKSIAC